MKCISVWQPFASLAVRGFKRFETRTWACPKSLIDETIGIASTKTIRLEQRAYFDDPEWMVFYADTLEKKLDELPHGFLLGTAVVDSCEMMTEEFMDSVTLEERAFGYWELGNYAWRLREPKAFEEPIRVRGMQGIWNFQPEPATVIALHASR